MLTVLYPYYLGLSATVSKFTTSSLPIVDLGTSVHQAQLNVENYSFKNIRYAEPPLGDLRFQLTQPITTINRTLNDGSYGNACLQASPASWSKQTGDLWEKAFPPKIFEEALAKEERQSEDCLFLDVVVPKTVFHRHNRRKRAPVMVWIHGGGYVSGAKDSKIDDPSQLMEQARLVNGQGIVYVALNYRLGMFGWLNPTNEEGIFPNVGLQDQRVALKWIKNNIHRFGGDPHRITVLGESAGGGSVMHHITGDGGTAETLFDRAIIQSPGFLVQIDPNAVWKRTLATASNITGKAISNGKELAALDSDTLKKINLKAVAESPHSTYTYGPTPDGDYIPDMPGALLLQGRFDSKPSLLLGHIAHEGLQYIEPAVNTSEKLAERIEVIFETMSDKEREYLLMELYPPAPQKGLYETEQDRGVLLFKEAVFACNNLFMSAAKKEKTYNYRFEIAPATHAQDVPYTFYHWKEDVGLPNPQLAEEMQRLFAAFVSFGDPNKRSRVGTRWELYGDERTLATFGEDGVGVDRDELGERRCDYWQRLPFPAK